MNRVRWLHQRLSTRWLVACLWKAALGGVLVGLAACTSSAKPIDWKQVDQAMGRPGTAQSGGVYRYSFPRSDRSVTVRGVSVKPAFALGSHAEFLPTGDGTMVMGDLVLTEDEVNPVLQKLQQGGIDQTALHNHLLTADPQVFYLHFWAHDDPIRLAKGLRAALDKTNSAKPST